MAESHSHGSTPASWTAVVVMIVGFLVAAFGVVLVDWWIIAVGFGVIVLGGIVGKVMSMMGLGQTASFTHGGAEEHAAGRVTEDEPTERSS